ncbi:matrix extracellular phosphoglycoprotein [Onychostruthus taczanowskii]|uniref:matrix extracellular phosphoglycoprotein n=1 Tax=Onychostruthus taczanowskii TaxID=356909 RepID=UPI001B80A130|nr:matrix extracellular phosphoglycoprotein [Onychostruthus taczanowskii]
MQTSLVCLCLCLFSTALTTPVPLPLPGRAAGNCVGQHRILLKSCNAKHGFYIFKYVYSFSTRRNQTQIKKEEADQQSIIPSHRLDEGNARQEPPAGSAGTAPEHSDNSSTEVIEYGIVIKPENHSTPGISTDGPSPHPGIGMRARGSGGGMGPTPSSSEGSGDLDLVVEVDGGVPILPQGERPSEVVVGNRSRVRNENKDDGAPRVVPVGGAMTAGRGRAPTTRGAGDEGSGEATVSGQWQEGVKQGTGTGGIALSSVTEKMEDVQVDAAGVDEYSYVPDSGSVTITHGSLGSTDRADGFTQVSPGKDDEVNIFIGRANIHVGEQVTTQAGVTESRENDGIPSMGSSKPLRRLDVTAAPSGDEDDSIPARRQPERLATTATPAHGDRVTSSLRDGSLTGEDEEGDTTIGADRGLVTPVPWRVTSGDITSPTVASIHGKDEDEVRGEGQKSKGKPDHVATTPSHHRGDMEATVTVPAKGASIHPAATEGDRTTPFVTASSHKAGTGPVLSRGGSGEVGTATSTPSHVEARPGAEVRVRPGGAGLDKTPRMDKAPFPRGKPGGWVSSRAQTTVGGYDGDAGGRSHATKAGASPAPQAGQDTGSMAAGRGQEWGRGAESRTAVPGAGGSRLPGHHGRRLGAGAPGTIATLGRSRQLDQVKRADELHVRERAFYSLGGAGGGPHGPYPGLGSADSSQSSEGDQGSHSESGQTGLQPSGWGSPGYPQGHWIQGPL